MLKGDETLRHLRGNGRADGCWNAAIKRLRSEGRAGVPVMSGDEMED